MIYDILPVNNYKGNNSTTTFYFDFYIENESQLKVTLFDNKKVAHELKLNVDYTINETKNQNGGFITFPIQGSSYKTLKEKENITLELILPISQEIKYNNSSLLNLETLEYSLDYLTRLIQILAIKQSLCVQANECVKITPKKLLNEIYSKASEIEKFSKIINSALEQIENNIILENEIKDYIQDNSDRFDKIITLETGVNDINIEIENLKNIKSNNNLDNVVNPSQAFKDMSASWTMPDYPRVVEKSANTEYIAPYDCLIMAGAKGLNNRYAFLGFRIKDINTYTDALSTTTNNFMSVCGFVPKGVKYDITSENSESFYAREYPLKGVI